MGLQSISIITAADGTESTFNGTYSNKQVILGESSETSGDITPFWANGASDYDAFKLVTGMAPIDKDQTGKWIENPAVLDNLEVTDNEDGKLQVVDWLNENWEKEKDHFQSLLL